MLVYLFDVQPSLATSYSLFIVGTTSLVGAYRNYLKGFINIKIALLFGSSSITTVFLVRKFVVPQIPDTLIATDSITITKATLTMLLFALLMIMASVSMIRSRQDGTTNEEQTSLPKLLLYGIGIGVVTGLLGAGGGFLIIPALVLFVKLPMKQAIGTSLLIIALNSLIGFTGDIGHYETDWRLLLTITAIAVAGIFIGGQISKSISGQKLKKGFGWFVLVMGTWIIVKETVLK